MPSGCHSGAIFIEAKDFQHSPTAQCSRYISLDCDGDGVLTGLGMSSEYIMTIPCDDKSMSPQEV